ncbi:MAG: hypothetical protein HRT61_21715, partial [Ekhidna sp.]|nr:hypothetical protein [Ekhidna sp.]
MKKYLLSLLLLGTLQIGFSQWGSFNLSFGLPQNAFRENTDATGFGADLTFGIPFQKGFPVSVGLDFNYMVYGFNSERLDLFADVTAQDGTLITRLDIPLRVVNTNSLFGTHVLVRAIAPFELVQPYGEALIGFRYISTNTRIEDRSDERRWARNPDDSDLISRQTVLDDWIFSYGFGGGFLINLGSNFFLDIRADYFQGQRAKYFDGEDTESW